MKKITAILVTVVIGVSSVIPTHAGVTAGASSIYSDVKTQMSVNEKYPTAGICSALKDAYEKGKVDGQKKYEKEQKRLKAEKKRLKEEKKKQEEYKMTHPHYEIYDGGEWHHMDTYIQDAFNDYCNYYGVSIENRKILHCQLWTETHFQSLISPTGDYGYAQINICNHDRLRRELGITDFMDPVQSIHCNVYIMSGYFNQYTISQALSKYNTGSAYNSTPYSRKVLMLYNNGAGVRLMEE